MALSWFHHWNDQGYKMSSEGTGFGSPRLVRRNPRTNETDPERRTMFRTLKTLISIITTVTALIVAYRELKKALGSLDTESDKNSDENSNHPKSVGSDDEPAWAAKDYGASDWRENP